MLPKYHFPLKPRLVEEMADLSSGEKMYKISLQHFVILESQGLVGL